jgi:outer membrane protein assembly factor BamB
MTLRSVCILISTCLLLAVSPAQAATPQNPLLLDDLIYVSQQGIYKFDRKQREPLWSSLAGVETFEPVIYQDLLLVGSTQGLYALNLDTGHVAWHIEKKHTLFTPTISAKAYAGSVHGELYAIDPKNGSIDWRRQFTGWIYSPVVSEESNRLWTGGQAHQVYAIDLRDGSLQHKIATTQESVFSAVDLGANEVAFNLFDGSTLMVGSSSGQVTAILEGDSQPNGIHAYRDTIYRSHRDGSLAAFDRQNPALKWRRTLAPQDLIMHPSQPGYLLLSDRDRTLLLLNLEQTNSPCPIQPENQWLLPLQFDTRNIVYFQKSMQPPGLTLVQIRAQCK